MTPKAKVAPDVGPVSGMRRAQRVMSQDRSCYHSPPLIAWLSLRVCDYGCTQVFGAKSYVDFWVSLPGSHLAWAIELLFEGVGGLEHAERFEQGGRYASTPLAKFAIIDFR